MVVCELSPFHLKLYCEVQYCKVNSCVCVLPLFTHLTYSQYSHADIIFILIPVLFPVHETFVVPTLFTMKLTLYYEVNDMYMLHSGSNSIHVTGKDR